MMDEVVASDERRQQAALESRKRQIEDTTIPDTAGVDNRNPPIEDAAHGAAWWGRRQRSRGFSTSAECACSLEFILIPYEEKYER